jgi:hypothetical protein
MRFGCERAFAEDYLRPLEVGDRKRSGEAASALKRRGHEKALRRLSLSRSRAVVGDPSAPMLLVFTKGCNSQEARLDSLPARLRATQPRPEVSGAPDRATLCQSRSRLETVAPYCEPGAIQSLLSAIRESASSVPHCSACIHAATRSPIMMQGIFADAPRPVVQRYRATDNTGHTSMRFAGSSPFPLYHWR